MSRLTTFALGAAVLCGLHSGATLAEKNLFGTLHGHSNWSIDAFGVGNTSLGPEKAYEFARGERVTHLNGAEVQLSQPLDFFMLSDPILLEKQMRPIKVDDLEVHFLAIIPIFEKEFTYKRGKTTRKLLKRFATNRVNETLDDFRESVMRSRIFHRR